MSTELAPKQEAGLTVKSLFNRDDVKNKFQEMLGKRATSFITSVLQIVASNKLLTNADPASIYHAAAVAATLDLPLNNNLGFAYIIPFNQSYQDEQGNWQKKQVAQFQLGYKGFIQLSQRSGQFSTINSTDVKEGEIKSFNRLTGEIEFDWNQTEQRDSLPVVGYVSYFRLINGFNKNLYMTVADVKKHGKKYSKTFGNDKGLWNTDFEAMAHKTVVKLLLARFAPLSVEMQKAVMTDQAIINNVEATDVTYIDNMPTPTVEIDKEEERILLLIEDCNDQKSLDKIIKKLSDEEKGKYLDIINSKMDSFL